MALFNNFVPIRNKIEDLFFRHYFWVIPAVYLFRSLIIWLDDSRALPYNLSDQPKILTEILLIAAFYLSIRFFTDFGPKLHELLSSPAITAKGGIDIKLVIDHIDQRLNSRFRIILGAIVSAAVLTYYVYRLNGQQSWADIPFFSFRFLDHLLYFIPASVYGYFVGVILWRLGVVLHSLYGIPNHFNVNPIIFHPDEAGGLDSVGYICTQLILIASVPTIGSALILFGEMINALVGRNIMQSGNAVLAEHFAPLILLVSSVGLLLGFLPLISFGSASKSKLYEGVLVRNDVSQKIISLRKRSLSRIEDKDFDLSAAVERLNYLNKLHQDASQTRISPLSSQRIRRIVVLLAYYFSQLATFWGFVSGLFKVNG